MNRVGYLKGNDVEESKISKVDCDISVGYNNGLKTVIIPAEMKREYNSFKDIVVKNTIMNKKLNILLIENTTIIEKERSKVEKILGSFSDSDYLSIINYGSSVRSSDIIECKCFNVKKLFRAEIFGENKCFYNALIELEHIVERYYHQIAKIDDLQIQIKSIDIIGIGTCSDNFSTISRSNGIKSFCKIRNLPDITTKYFCLDEQNFVEAASIGFRSIGAIPKKIL